MTEPLPNAKRDATKWAHKHPGHDVRISGNAVKAIAECLDCEQGKVFGDPSDVLEQVNIQPCGDCSS